MIVAAGIILWHVVAWLRGEEVFAGFVRDPQTGKFTDLSGVRAVPNGSYVTYS